MVDLAKRPTGAGTPPTQLRQVHDRAVSSAGLSVLVPGLGQALQHRYVPAILQFGTVAAYVLAAGGAGWGRAMWLAVAWNVWSAAEAWWFERRRGFRAVIEESAPYED